MKKNSQLIKILLTFALIVFSGCQQPESSTKQEVDTSAKSYPAWIMNPNKNGKTGAIGSAYVHYKGFTFQRKLAITRALDEMALQQGVKVSLSLKKKESVRNNNVSTNLDIDSSYDTKSRIITAHIEESWLDEKTNEFFIWLVLD